MPELPEVTDTLNGLPSRSVPALQIKYGRNEFAGRRRTPVLETVWGMVKDPMTILLIISCLLYFLLGENTEGFMMMAALALVSAIGVYQEVRSSKAISKLKEMIAPDVTVIRDGMRSTISSAELVPGDVILLEEGQKVPADADIVEAHDFSVNEAIITGESMPLFKTAADTEKQLHQGTLVNSGSCKAVVIATGNHTRLASIGRLVEDPVYAKTMLQVQTGKVVKKLALFGLAGFVIIFVVNFLHQRQVVTSLLSALTLAMSVIPEEIPVAFSSFMALGAYKLSKAGVFIRQPQITENLGCMDVLCVDKTGTITENKMAVHSVYDYRQDILTEDITTCERVLLYGTLASEEMPFDSMEKAITDACFSLPAVDQKRPPMVKEYPIGGTPPMMTHVYNDSGKIIATAKGAPERIITVCRINDNERAKLTAHISQMSRAGMRVLGVASAVVPNEQFPPDQDGFAWQLEGFIALFDPPKKNIPEVVRKIYEAKVEIKLVTGDYPETAMSIATQAGIEQRTNSYTGDQVMQMTDQELRQAAGYGNVFSRMFPEAKLRLINCLREMGHTTGMIGDGVNDAPALKAANIGIAMGKRGTEMAQQAADIVIADDNLAKITTAISEGRKIFHNLRKSIHYIISIHIPILLIATIPLLLGWKFPNIFTPVHIIFLELIMGPTCSIFFEREPVEHSSITAGPRKSSAALLQKKDVLISVIQGIVIAAACLTLYYFFIQKGESLETIRAAVFVTLIIANILLTFSVRSSTETILKTSRYKNNLALPVLGASLMFLGLIIFSPAVRSLFGLSLLQPSFFFICAAAAVVSVGWFEIYKIIRYGRHDSPATEVPAYV